MSWTIPFPTGPFVRGHAIGGGGGTGFQVTEIFQGKLVRTVGVHFNNENLRGLRLTYTDGSRSPLIGSAVQSYRELTFQPGETIVHASLWGNGRGTRTGRIRFTTSRNQVLDVGRNTTGQDEFGMNVGSGILAGFSGRHGGDIDALSFIFLLHGFQATVSNVRYTHPPPNDSIKQVVLQEARFANEHHTSPTQWLFRNTVTRTNSWSWSQSATFNFSHNINVRASFYRLVRVESNTRWELGLEATRSGSASQTVELGWDLSGTLQPGEVILATSTASHGQADVPYTATVTISAPSSPHTIVYQENGVLANAVFIFAEATSRKIQPANVRKAEGDHSEPERVLESSDSVEEVGPGDPAQQISSAEDAEDAKVEA